MQLTAEQLRRAADAARVLQKNELAVVFDASRPGSRPTAAQERVLREIGRVQFRFVVAGVQSGKCLVTGTLVATPRGPVPIEDLEAGDYVYDEHGRPVRVLTKFDQGKQLVREVVRGRGTSVAFATDNHRWMTSDGRLVYTKDLLETPEVLATADFCAPMGDRYEPHAYALGALLGDGCSRQGGNSFHISSEDDRVPLAVASALGDNYEVVSQHETNHTWGIRRREVVGGRLARAHCRHYDAWCRDRYAHEKIVDIDVLKTWDRRSLCAFLAGLLDSDGSVYSSQSNALVLNWAMQARSVIEAIQWLLLALWGVEAHIKTDERDKYINAPVLSLKVTRLQKCVRILKEIDEFVVTPRKKMKPEYLGLAPDRQLRCRVRPEETRLRLANTWDIEVDSPTHLFLLANGTVTHNSSCAAREFAWILEDNHPYWKRPVHWGTGPLTMLIVGQDRRQIELNLWEGKLKPLLNADEWREVRSSSSLQWVEHKTKGHKVVLLSHTDSSEKNRKAVQGWVAHALWLDEMPSSIKMLNELMSRVNSMRGSFIATFSPMLRSPEVRKLIESMSPPIGDVYRFSKLDNPIVDREAELAKVAGLPESLRNTVLYGEWLPSDGAVYYYDADLHGGPLPETYSRSWRHVAVADPATESKTGFSLWAEDPQTGQWWCTQSDYITISKIPTEIISEIERRLAGHNVIERRCDSAEGWFIRQANNMGFPWRAVEYKNGTPKDTMIRLFQEALGSRLRIPEFNTNFVEELQTCERSPTTGRLIRPSTYHIVDTGHYFAMRIPERDIHQVPRTWHQKLFEEHFAAEVAAERRKKMPQSNGRIVHRVEPTSDTRREPPLVAPAPRAPSRIQRRRWRIS